MLTYKYVTEGCQNYMKEFMLNGSALSQSLARLLDLQKGKVAVYPNVDIDEMKGPSFYWGGQNRTQSPDKPLVEELTTYLGHPRRFAMFEHRHARADDPLTDEQRRCFAVVGNKIYYPLEAFSSADTVEDARRQTFVATGTVTVAGVLPASDELLTARELLNRGESKSIVQCVNVVIVPAFDGEGWLWWTSNQDFRH